MSIDKHFRVRHGLSVNTAGSNATVEIAANDAILVPRGASGERPATAANGMFRYNTTSGSFEGYIAGAWTALTDATTASDMETSTYDPAGVSEQLVGLTAVQTLTNKTLTSPTINTSINLPAGAINAITEIASGLKSGIDLTLITGTAGTSGDFAVWNADGDLVDGPSPPAGALVGTTATQTLTNKTLTSPTINTSINLPAGAINAITEIASGLKSGIDGTLITGTSGTSGDFAVWNADGDLVDGPTPPAGSLVGTTATQTLTNKTLTSPTINTSINLPAGAINAITEIASGLKSGADGTLITGTAGGSGSLAQWNVDGDLVTLAAPAGSLVGTTASQTLTNKTLTSPSMTTVSITSGGMNISGGTANLSSGSLTVGINNSVNGQILIYGGGNAEQGGRLYLYNAADHDTNEDYWLIQAADGSGDFVIQGATGTEAFRADETTNAVTLNAANGQVIIGASDSVPAQLVMYGGGTGEAGAIIDLYNNADDDTTTNFWRLTAHDSSGTFRISEDGTRADFIINPDGLVQLSPGTTSAGIVVIGQDDVNSGLLRIFGGSTGVGGLIELYNSADVDTTTSYWGIRASATTGDFSIFDDNGGTTVIGATGGDATPLVYGDVIMGDIPGGRLTMVSGDNELGSDSSGGTIYYTPALHNRIALYDGGKWVLHYFSELTNANNNTTDNPAATVADSNYDLFVWNDGGTIKLSRGPAWTSNTARGTGAGTTELIDQDSVPVNAVNITNGPAAKTGRYVGSVRTVNGNFYQLRRYGAGSSGNQTVHLGIHNYYNPVNHAWHMDPDGGSYTLNTTTYRTFEGDGGNRIHIINGSGTSGLPVSCIAWVYNVAGNSGTNRVYVAWGVAVNGQDARSSLGRSDNGVQNHGLTCFADLYVSSGFYTLRPCERTENTSGNATVYPADSTFHGSVVM